MGKQITIQNVRLAFPVLFVPRATTGDDGKPGKPKYSGSFIMPPDHPQMDELRKTIMAVATEQWKEDTAGVMKALRLQDRICLHDGDTKSKYAGFEGNMFISANSDVRPSVFDRNKTPLTADDGKPYAGCYVDVSLDIYAQDHKKWGKRVNAGLRGVRFLKDGDAFSASTSAAKDEFADLGDQGESAAGSDPWA